MVFQSHGAKFDPGCIPDSVPVSRFMLEEEHGRCRLEDSKVPLVHALSGRQISTLDLKNRVDWLARGLAKELSWQPNEGSEWDKVVVIFAENSLDFLPVSWAVHDLGGVVSPANAAYKSKELNHHLQSSGACVVFTTISLLTTAAAALNGSGVRRERVYILGEPGGDPPEDLRSVEALIAEGSKLPPIPRLQWSKGQGARQCAFLMYSSGTTGLPKGVVVSHKNIIANVLQISAFEADQRTPHQHEVVLGLLPQTHIYGLVAVFHLSIYRGDQVIVLPEFKINTLCQSIEAYKINVLYVVPPIIVSMLRASKGLSKFDLSSVTEVFSGAASLDPDTIKSLREQHPSWIIRQAYGMTETATVVSSTPKYDVVPGSVGTLLPGVRARIMSLTSDLEVSGHGEAGELQIQSPSVTDLGYRNNPQATQETFGERGDQWLRTGDKAMFMQSPHGREHLFIVDRIKELIKVKGHQVAPAELESLLLSHPFVEDVAVIPVPDHAAGEVPKACVVLSQEPRPLAFQSEREIEDELHDFVRTEKAHYKWLKGGIEFVDHIPRSPSGKILRRILRDQRDYRSTKQRGARL
ncbi:hypothetical protein CERZMDRAFT_35046 [Cercospora zeae-maydis SCOH1-5]|uniref:Phenylacetyl-CoA ligase n=1 Tax=Cercospora zeae-maydis SCOH1-5 TaxID=717836 RepID=A0A6A6FQI6_9PEZI|nr:hypothetical protein CERZMDRAFT_35046 [Cercospora zeae-maydis SCOH1-5]